MGTYTQNLNLYNTNMEADGNDTFDFQRDINDNNDKIDAFAGNIQKSKVNINADNFSTIGKELITSLTIPDYTTRRQGVTGFNIWKTVTSNCWVSVSSQATMPNRTLWLLLKDEKGNTIQGVTDRNAIVRAQQGNSNCMNQVFVYIPKGYSYQAIIDSDQIFYSSYEYALKGG